ncbi:MAG: hypothetical protein ACT4PM_13105 [Gemmatimonadales bacterium]
MDLEIHVPVVPGPCSDQVADEDVLLEPAEIVLGPRIAASVSTRVVTLERRPDMKLWAVRLALLTPLRRRS